MSEELPPNERPQSEQPFPPSPPPPPPPRHSWEDEKTREKEREKEQEKTQEKETEKSQGYAEKYRRDPLSGVFWAGILILAGFIFLADNLDFLPTIPGMDAWHWIMLGAGGLLFLEALVRLVSPDYARPLTGRLIFACILVAGGLSQIIDLMVLWPAVLMLIGLSILIKNIRQT